MTTYTIKPAGGGDFADLATAETALGAGDHTLECSAGDVGTVTFDNPTPTSILVTVAVASRCNPLINAGDSGFAYSSGSVDVVRSGVTIEHLRGASIGASALAAHVTSATIRDCQSTGGFVFSTLDFNLTGCTIRNCAAFHQAFGLYAGPTGFGSASTMTMIADNLSIRTGAADLSGVLMQPINAGANGTLNLTMRNIVATGASGAGFDFLDQSAGGTLNVTASNNASGDGSANDFGGTGHLVDQSAASWFRNPASDLRLKAGSPGIDAGVTIGAVTTDANGIARPQGAAYDIGADEYVAAETARRNSRLRGCRFGGGVNIRA